MSDAHSHAEPTRADLLRPVLDAAAMRAADAFTIEEIGIPGFTLMETAGREAARMAANDLPPGSHVLICVGKGNNGGDGLVVARWLADAGYTVEALLTAEPDDLTPDAATNLDILRAMMSAEAIAGLTVTPAKEWLPSDLTNRRADLIVDALFGTGLESTLRSPFDAIVDAINHHPAPVCALDMPSGLSATTGEAFEPCIRATSTITMGAVKVGHLVQDGPDVSGSVRVVDIGIPASALKKHAAQPGSGFGSTSEWAASFVRPRARNDHKYTTGPTLIVGGSDAFPGAPALAARAAARMGSGYVVAIGPESIRPQLQESLDAIPVAGWSVEAPPADTVSLLIEQLDSRWTKARSLLIGPGLGREAQTREMIWELLSRFEGSVVLDADALYALAGDQEKVAAASGGRWIMTPHAGELARLDSISSDDSNSVARIQRVAREWNCVVLAKGQPSITAAPDGRTIINRSGHPAASTAGSGDVLAGIVSGLLAQEVAPFDAAAAGIHIGGTAAGLFVERGASQSMVATDIIDLLPEVLRLLS